MVTKEKRTRRRNVGLSIAPRSGTWDTTISSSQLQPFLLKHKQISCHKLVVRESEWCVHQCPSKPLLAH